MSELRDKEKNRRQENKGEVGETEVSLKRCEITTGRGRQEAKEHMINRDIQRLAEIERDERVTVGTDGKMYK